MFAGTVTGLAQYGSYQSGTGINLTGSSSGSGVVTGLPQYGSYQSGTGINLNSADGGGGTWSSAPAPVSYFGSQPGYAYSWMLPGGGAPGYSPGVAARGAFGEGGPYTELDYPEMRFLRAGENPTELLSSLRQRRAGKPNTLAQALVIGLVAFALLKK